MPEYLKSSALYKSLNGESYLQEASKVKKIFQNHNYIKVIEKGINGD